MPRPKDNPDARLTIGYSIYCLPRSGLVQPWFLKPRVSEGESEAASSAGRLGVGEDGRVLRQLGHTKGTQPQLDSLSDG